MPGCNALSPATMSSLLLPGRVLHFQKILIFMDVLRVPFFGSLSFPYVYKHPKLRCVSPTHLPDTS